MSTENNKIEQVQVTKTSRMIELFEQGLTTGQIADEMGIRFQHVYNTLRSKGLIQKGATRGDGEPTKTSRIVAAYDELGSVSKAADAVGVRYQHAYNVLRAEGKIKKVNHTA